MRLKLQPAAVEDAEAIAALRNAVSDDLTFKHGKGWWTSCCTTAGVLLDLRRANPYVALYRDEIVCSLVLGTRKPWAIDLKFFSKVKKPLYLTSLVVAPEHQRRGLGRAALVEAVKIAHRARADAIFLDAWDHPVVSAGPFYAKCGWKETGRATYRNVPLIYYELVL